MCVIDADKTFGNLTYVFLFKIVEDMNFGRNFIKWVKYICTPWMAQIIVNKNSTKPHDILKGARQSTPLFPLLFVLLLEILNRDIRQDERTVGIQI